MNNNDILAISTETDEEAKPDQLLTPAEVAALFRVSPRTVSRWAKSGKVRAVRTLGGHRRFRASEVKAAIAACQDN